jgi:2-iminobutanoate/2-iminopropanoate deaminase
MTHLATRTFAPARLTRDQPGRQLLFVSGTICRDVDASGDAGVQTRRIFDAIGRLLAGYRAGFADVVQVRCFLTNLADYAAYDGVRQEIFGALEVLPASATVGVAALLGEGTRVEVEVVAEVEKAS